MQLSNKRNGRLNMCYFIAIEDLVENALVNKIVGDDNFISYRELKDYGAKAISILSNGGEKAVLVLSRESTSHMLSDYSKYIEETEHNGAKGIGLKAGVKQEELINRLRGYLPLDVVLAFIEAGKSVFSAK